MPNKSFSPFLGVNKNKGQKKKRDTKKRGWAWDFGPTGHRGGWSRCPGFRSHPGLLLNGLAALLQIGSIASLCVLVQWMSAGILQLQLPFVLETNAAICVQDSLTFSDSISQSKGNTGSGFHTTDL